MGILEADALRHWNYFLALDDDMARFSRYVELTTANFEAYSLELARVLFAAASEVDVVAKMLCHQLDVSSRAANINQYRERIVTDQPLITQTRIHIPRFGLTLEPWNAWRKEKTPLWWTACNKVKHHRHTHFSEANLKNALNAVAGLFVLLLFFHRVEAQRGLLCPDPVLFQAGAPFEVSRNLYEPYAIIYRTVS
jgi:hypothetical protein